MAHLRLNKTPQPTCRMHDDPRRDLCGKTFLCLFVANSHLPQFNIHRSTLRCLVSIVWSLTDPGPPTPDPGKFSPKNLPFFQLLNILKHFLARRTPVFYNFLPNFPTFKHLSKRPMPVFTLKTAVQLFCLFTFYFLFPIFSPISRVAPRNFTFSPAFFLQK